MKMFLLCVCVIHFRCIFGPPLNKRFIRFNKFLGSYIEGEGRVLACRGHCVVSENIHTPPTEGFFEPPTPTPRNSISLSYFRSQKLGF